MTSDDLALLYTILLGLGIALSYLIILILISRIQDYLKYRRWRNIFAKLNINEIERINRRN